MLRFLKTYPYLLSFGLLFTFFSSYGQTFLLALYVPSIQAAFDLSNSAFGSIYGIATAFSAVVLIYAGKKIDDIPLKHYMLFVLIGLSGFLFLASVVNSIYLLVFVFFGLRFFGQGLMTHTSITSMIKYFDQDRGKALSIAALGHPLG
ncbi:MAG: MFS transporter [Cyclobacteriaceae bacterium]|nr:MFS transporter [Cyclobacteriaceae bacterium]